jgi:hypothetical protein
MDNLDSCCLVQESSLILRPLCLSMALGGQRMLTMY